MPRSSIWRGLAGLALLGACLWSRPAAAGVTARGESSGAVLGIEMKIRLVDQSQFIQRVQKFDFDMIWAGWGQSLNPGNEQRIYWGSYTADRVGSRLDGVVHAIGFAPESCLGGGFLDAVQPAAVFGDGVLCAFDLACGCLTAELPGQLAHLGDGLGGDGFTEAGQAA